MNGMDDLMGGGPEPSLREQAEALIPALRMFQVITERYDDGGIPHNKTETVIANSANVSDSGMVVFFTMRFIEPDKLVSFVTRMIGGQVLDVEDKGEVPVSRILH